MNIGEEENGQLALAKRAGRPTKFNDAALDQLCAALADGCPIKCACTVAGIGVTTLSEWREKYPEVNQRMDEARELARQNALQSIKSAGEKDWRANAEWLRLSFPADYRGNNSVRYEAVNAMLLNEFLKEHRKVEEQEATITQVKSTVAKQEALIAKQQKQIEALTAGLQKVSAQLEVNKPAPQLVADNQ